VRVRRAIVDRHCRLDAGMEVGARPEKDSTRFRVTEKGLTLVTPEMLGQPVHQLR
jgi:glucose-1-phosphate adenylyltransferase